MKMDRPSAEELGRIKIALADLPANAAVIPFDCQVA